MNTRDIATVLRKDPFARRVFRGVYPRDKLPSSPVTIARHPSAFIINTDTSRGAGIHWTAVYFFGNGKSVFFDSFGRPPQPDIERFILKNSFSYRFNNRLLQDMLSSACGLYVIYFVLQTSRGISLNRLLAVFHHLKLNTNDRTVLRLVKPFL